MSTNNIVKLPVNPVALFEEITDLHNQKMARYQYMYQQCDEDTDAGQALMTEIALLVRVEERNYEISVELKEQNHDLTVKNDILVSALEVVKNREHDEVTRMRDIQVRLERMKESNHTKSQGKKNSRLYNGVTQSARNGSHR